MIPPYASNDPRNIRRITPVAAPVIAAPRAQNLNYRDAPMEPILSQPDVATLSGAPDPTIQPPDSAGATNLPTPSPGKAEVPGTRHGVGGRIKDFLEAALYGLAQGGQGHGGNQYSGLMSGLGAGIAAAAKPGALAQYKWNNFEQPRIDERNQREAEQETLKQQALLRSAQARKAMSDSEEDTQMRPYRQRQMQAQTTLAEANAQHALRPQATPRTPLEKIDTDQGPMRWNPDTQRAEPILGANGQPVGRYEKPVKEPSLTPYQQYQVGRDANQDAERQRKEGGALLDDFEKVKKNVTALDTEKNELWKATGQAPNAKGFIPYKGHDYTPSELAALAQQKETDWQAAQAEFGQARQKVAGHPALELDESGVGARYKRSAPQANTPSVKGGKVPVITKGSIAAAAQRKGMTPEQFAQWFTSPQIGGVIQ